MDSVETSTLSLPTAISREGLCAVETCKYRRCAENRYCLVHKVHVFLDATRDAGKRACAGYIRKCRVQLEISDPRSKCQECLDKDKEKDQKRRDKTKAANTLIPEMTTEKGCTACCKTLPIEQFAKARDPHSLSATCLSCREESNRNNAKRDPEKTKEHRKKQDAKPERNERIDGKRVKR